MHDTILLELSIEKKLTNLSVRCGGLHSCVIDIYVQVSRKHLFFVLLVDTQSRFFRLSKQLRDRHVFVFIDIRISQEVRVCLQLDRFSNGDIDSDREPIVNSGPIFSP